MENEIVQASMGRALFYVAIIASVYLFIDFIWGKHIRAQRAKKEAANARWLDKMVKKVINATSINDLLDVKSEFDRDKNEYTTNNYDFLRLLRKLEDTLKEKLDALTVEDGR